MGKGGKEIDAMERKLLEKKRLSVLKAGLCNDSFEGREGNFEEVRGKLGYFGGFRR